MIQPDWKATHLIKWKEASVRTSEPFRNSYVMLVEEEVDGYYWAYTEEEWEKWKKRDCISLKFELSTQHNPLPVTWAYQLHEQDWCYMKRYSLPGILFHAEELHNLE